MRTLTLNSERIAQLASSYGIEVKTNGTLFIVLIPSNYPRVSTTFGRDLLHFLPMEQDSPIDDFYFSLFEERMAGSVNLVMMESEHVLPTLCLIWPDVISVLDPIDCYDLSDYALALDAVTSQSDRPFAKGGIHEN